VKIGVLNDFLPQNRAGGASRAISLYLKNAPEEFEIAFCTPGNLDRDCDFYIIFLCKTFPDHELSYVQTRPFAWSGFDWWPEEDGQSKWRNLLVKKAKISYFVSPLHRERFSRLYGVKPSNPLVLPPPLDLANLRGVDLPETRNGRGLWASEWHVAKGPDLAGALANRLKIHLDMYSPSMPPNILSSPNIFTPYSHPAGYVAEEHWYSTMAQYSYLIHTPRVPDAFGYIVLEAYALGLEVVLSGRSGVESWRQSFEELLVSADAAQHDFWKHLATVM